MGVGGGPTSRLASQPEFKTAEKDPSGVKPALGPHSKPFPVEMMLVPLKRDGGAPSGSCRAAGCQGEGKAGHRFLQDTQPPPRAEGECRGWRKGPNLDCSHHPTLYRQPPAAARARAQKVGGGHGCSPCATASPCVHQVSVRAPGCQWLSTRPSQSRTASQEAAGLPPVHG